MRNVYMSKLIKKRLGIKSIEKYGKYNFYSKVFCNLRNENIGFDDCDVMCILRLIRRKKYLITKDDFDYVINAHIEYRRSSKFYQSFLLYMDQLNKTNRLKQKREIITLNDNNNNNNNSTANIPSYNLRSKSKVQPISVPTLMWDENKKSNNSTYSNNNLTVTKTSGKGRWNCGVIGNVAVDKFTVRIDDKGDNVFMMIGFTSGDNWDPNGVNFNWDPNGVNFRTDGWFINFYSGCLYGNRIGRNGIPYTLPFNNGDYITVIREGNTIRFEKNKIDLALGICNGLTNIPNQPLFPALDIVYHNEAVTIVNNY